MNKKTISLFLLGMLCSYTIIAQETNSELNLTSKDSIIVSSWIVGIGINAVDDAGDEFNELFNSTDNWNMVPFPSRISIGRYFKSGLGLELIGAYNKYKQGKVIDQATITEDINYYSGDLRLTYDLNRLVGRTGVFSPYAGGGIGYTDANNQGRGTYNATVGVRAWFTENFGIDLNSTGKWTMNKDNSSNHIQHAAGVVYRFGIEKGLNKRGKEKLRALQELEEQRKRERDSIEAAKRAAEEEARRLAEELRKEEAERLAAEKSKEDEEIARRQKIDDAINGLGKVYFDLNSSYLSNDAKRLLDNMIAILNENESVVIEVSAYTDARGSNKYNLWLSQRRVERTMQYLLEKGIDESRIKAEAFGEENLTNECADYVPCPEEKHRENRRSEFKVLQY